MSNIEKKFSLNDFFPNKDDTNYKFIINFIHCADLEEQLLTHLIEDYLNRFSNLKDTNLNDNVIDPKEVGELFLQNTMNFLKDAVHLEKNYGICKNNKRLANFIKMS
jgi:hypothetical protein